MWFKSIKTSKYLFFRSFGRRVEKKTSKIRKKIPCKSKFDQSNQILIANKFKRQIVTSAKDVAKFSVVLPVGGWSIPSLRRLCYTKQLDDGNRRELLKSRSDASGKFWIPDRLPLGFDAFVERSLSRMWSFFHWMFNNLKLFISEEFPDDATVADLAGDRGDWKLVKFFV